MTSSLKLPTLIVVRDVPLEEILATVEGLEPSVLTAE